MMETLVVVAFAVCHLVQLVDAKKAGGGAGVALATRGNNDGADNEGIGGNLDDTTIIVLACFGGLAVLFCALATLSKVGASKLSRRSAQNAAQLAVEALELPRLPEGARVTLRHRGQGDTQNIFLSSRRKKNAREETKGASSIRKEPLPFAPPSIVLSIRVHIHKHAHDTTHDERCASIQ